MNSMHEYRLARCMRICTSQEMREIDMIAEKQYLVDPDILMENAGRGAVEMIFEHYPGAGRDTEFLIMAGKGNNAGDAFVVARRLICLERRVRIFTLLPPDSYKGAVRKNFDILRAMNAKITYLEAPSDLEAFFRSSSGPYTIIDGIFGTGLKGNLEGNFYDVVEVINRQQVQQVIALDMPSGVNGDTGKIHGVAIDATLTVSFGFPKLGHFMPPGASKRGLLVNVDISLPPRFRNEGDKFLLLKSAMASLLASRDRYGHKNSFGHALLIGGSPGRLGAINMASRACHKTGAGLVTVATWKDSFDTLLARLADETMAVPLALEGEEYEVYRRNLKQYSSIVMGPGLGMREDAKKLLQEILSNYRGPVVLDADAINLVGEHHLHDFIVKRGAPTILTPHMGEMARLLGRPKSSILEDPAKAVRDAVDQTHAVVLLKGAATLIGSVEGQLFLNHYPNDGMATAGSGDVLAGMIGGLLGQDMDALHATQLGVFLHSLAGDHAAKALGHRSMTATAIIENIGNAYKELQETKAPSFPEEGRARLR